MSIAIALDAHPKHFPGALGLVIEDAGVFVGGGAEDAIAFGKIIACG